MIEETYKVDGLPHVDIRIQSGRVRVAEGPVNQVHVRIDSKDPDLYVAQRGNTVEIASEKNSSWVTRGSTYIDVTTPPGSGLYVGAGSASVECDVPLGKVELKTASGDCNLSAADVLVVKNASGDVYVGSVENALRFTSASGDLFVTEVLRGSGNISTASGDVEIESSEETLNISTVSGDVDIKRCVGRTNQLKSMSGSFEVGIPAGTSVDLDVNLLSGRLRLPKGNGDKKPVERDITIKVKSVSGDLNINRID